VEVLEETNLGFSFVVGVKELFLFLILLAIVVHVVIIAVVAIVMTVAIVNFILILHGLRLDGALVINVGGLGVGGAGLRARGWLLNTAALDLVKSWLLLGRCVVKRAAVLVVITIPILHLLWRTLRSALTRSGLLGRTIVVFKSVSSVPMGILTCTLKVCGDSFTCNAITVFTGNGCKKLANIQSSSEWSITGGGERKGKKKQKENLKESAWWIILSRVCHLKFQLSWLGPPS
jgi:hypothetical protein